MKERTHIVFSVGVLLYAVSRARYMPQLSILLAVWLAIVVNLVIDELGHSSRNGMRVRSDATHSTLTAPLWGGLLGVASVAIPSLIMTGATEAGLVLFSAGEGVVAGCTHLLLDALTEGGVYHKGRRKAIAHMRYDNRLANVSFTLLGAALTAASLYLILKP